MDEEKQRNRTRGTDRRILPMLPFQVRHEHIHRCFSRLFEWPGKEKWVSVNVMPMNYLKVRNEFQFEGGRLSIAVRHGLGQGVEFVLQLLFEHQNFCGRRILEKPIGEFQGLDKGKKRVLFVQRRLLTRLARSMASSIFCIWLVKTVCFSPNALSSSLINGEKMRRNIPFFVPYLQKFVLSIVDQLSIECIGFINIMLGFTILSLDQQSRSGHWMVSFFHIPGAGCTRDRPSVANVSGHSNVVECFRPYFVISLLDVILRKKDRRRRHIQNNNKNFTCIV